MFLLRRRVQGERQPADTIRPPQIALLCAKALTESEAQERVGDSAERLEELREEESAAAANG